MLICWVVDLGADLNAADVNKQTPLHVRYPCLCVVPFRYSVLLAMDTVSIRAELELSLLFALLELRSTLQDRDMLMYRHSKVGCRCR